MATIVTWNGGTFTVPATGEENWGGVTKVDGLLISLVNNGFQKTGGVFTLSADADFGVTAGLKSIYYKSRGTVATAGVLRLAKAESLAWLNNAGSGNNLLTTDNSDNLTYNGTIITSSAGVVPVAAGGTGLTSYTTGDTLYASGATTLSKLAIGAANTVNVSTGTAPSWATLVNANINASAAIAYSKLALTGAILNADLAGSIAASKLVGSDIATVGTITSGTWHGTAIANVYGGTGADSSAATGLAKVAAGTWSWATLVNADVSGSAAIAYSKLNLSGSVLNADVNASAAIAYSKLAALTSAHILVGSAGNVATDTAVTGDVTISNSGVTTIAALAVTAAKMSSGAATSGYVATADGSGNVSYAAVASSPNQSYELNNLGLSVTVAANACTIALKQGDGSTDPSTGTAAVKIGFRSATATTGGYSEVSTTAAASVVIPSGTTIGTLNNTLAYLWVYAINNAGTVELAVSLTRFDEGSVQSSSAISGGATATTLYSTTARTSKAIRLIGRVTITAATAGTWASSPTEVSVVPFRNCFAPTIQRFTSGSGTYTPTAGTIYSIVEIVGDGGGGGADTTNAGSNGSNTTFGGSTAGGGSGGAANSGDGGAGGTNTVGSGHTAIDNVTGGRGVSGQGHQAISISLNGGSGGMNVKGGAGVPSNTNAGLAGVANTGGGGAGGSQSNANTGAGGGAGGYLKILVTNPIAVSYSIGGGGNGGSAGGAAGGNGGSGLVIVWDYTG